MKRISIAWVGTFALAALLGIAIGTARADDAHYGFPTDETSSYKIIVKTMIPESLHTQVSYLVARAVSVDANGQTALAYNWDLDNGPASLWWMFINPATEHRRQILIDPHGAILDAASVKNDAQLDASQGPAWRLVVEPLPPAGQNNWTTHQEIKLLGDNGGDSFPFGRGGFRGSFGGGFGEPPPQGDAMADETITYTADAPLGNQVTIHRHYDLATKPDVAESLKEHLHGEGQYVFDTQGGRVISLSWKLNLEVRGRDAMVSIPVTADAHLMTSDELATVKSAMDADVAAQNEARANLLAKTTAQGMLPDDALVQDYKSLPDRMVRTEVAGTAQSWPFTAASKDPKPMIGLRIVLRESSGNQVFSAFQPVFTQPTMPPEKGVINVVAKEGYAVGAINVNAGEFLDAISVTFMKKTDNGLDKNDSYASPWYGQKIGTDEKILGGDGGFVFGIFGRKREKVDAIGLIMDMPAGYDKTAGNAAIEAKEADAAAKVAKEKEAEAAKEAEANAQSQAKADAIEAQKKAQFDAEFKARRDMIQARLQVQNKAQGKLPLDEMVTDIDNIPSDMLKTDIVGTTQASALFVTASRSHKPVVGFVMKLGSSNNRACISALEPLYSNPTNRPRNGGFVVIAKDGYAVGSVTVNADEFLNALCVRFMKITKTGLDPTTSYVSMWYGKKIGTSQKKLDGKGTFVYGVCGRKGLNIDALGLVIAAPPTDNNNNNNKP